MSSRRPMRVIAGTLGGRRLVAPPGQGTRPTSERVREAVFNALWSLDVLDGATVLDLFAGSGAMGFEALSRGATHVTFVERDPAALAAIETNARALGVSDRITVRRADAEAFVTGPISPTVDLAIADPPYAFEGWDAVLGGLRTEWAVLESSRPVVVDDPWRVIRQRTYGGTAVVIAQRAPSLENP